MDETRQATIICILIGEHQAATLGSGDTADAQRIAHLPGGEWTKPLDRYKAGPIGEVLRD